jgi:hypothetical protein
VGGTFASSFALYPKVPGKNEREHSTKCTSIGMKTMKNANITTDRNAQHNFYFWLFFNCFSRSFRALTQVAQRTSNEKQEAASMPHRATPYCVLALPQSGIHSSLTHHPPANTTHTAAHTCITQSAAPHESKATRVRTAIHPATARTWGATSTGQPAAGNGGLRKLKIVHTIFFFFTLFCTEIAPHVSSHVHQKIKRSHNPHKNNAFPFSWQRESCF